MVGGYGGHIGPIPQVQRNGFCLKPDGTSKTHAEAILRQLLHIEQVRRVVHDNYNRFRDEMNSWENNLVGNIKDMVKEATNGRPD